MPKKKKRTLKKKHISKKHISKKHASKKHVSKKHHKKKLKPSYSPKAKGAISGTTFMLEDVVSQSPEPMTSSPKI